MWNPQALAVADPVSLCEINSPAAPSPAVAARSLSLRVYIVFGGGNPSVVAQFDADAAPVRAWSNCQKNLEVRPGAPAVSIGLSAF